MQEGFGNGFQYGYSHLFSPTNSPTIRPPPLQSVDVEGGGAERTKSKSRNEFEFLAKVFASFFRRRKFTDESLG